MALTNKQFDEIMREYSRKQLADIREAEERQAAIYQAIPRLSEIDAAISSLSLQATKALLASKLNSDNTSNNISNYFSKELSALRQEKESLLKQEGYNLSDLEVQYECSDCKDTGYIKGVKCHCFKQAEIRLIYQQSNLNGRSNLETFDTFDFDFYSQNSQSKDTSSYDYAKKAYEECINFVKNFDKNTDNLLLFGDTGVGKTFLCNSIAKELITKGKSVIYLTAKELFDIINSSVFDRDFDAKSSYDYLFSCDLLIIDDLGTEFSNSFTVTQMYYLINERLLSERSTVISTNLSIGDIQDTYSERTSSRIVGNYKILKLIGKDIRLAKRLK